MINDLRDFIAECEKAGEPKWVKAEAATLTIMVGGDKQAFHDYYNVLEAMGKHIVYCGGNGAGCRISMPRIEIILYFWGRLNAIMRWR